VDFARLAAAVHAALTPGGALVFSVEHPMVTAPRAPGWIEDGGIRRWPVDSYLDEGPRVTDWLAPGVVKQHRTMASTLSALLRSGLQLDAVVEWGPSPAQTAAHPEWAAERERPPFLLVACSAES
jgi:hypothetical protein